MSFSKSAPVIYFETILNFFVTDTLYTSVIHAKTGKRKLIARLANWEISIRCDRVLHIRCKFSNQVFGKYLLEGMVCPSQLQKNIFKKISVENYDHNLTLAIAELHFTEHLSCYFNSPMLCSFPAFSKRPTKLTLLKSYANIKLTPTKKPDRIGSCNLNPSNLFQLTAEEEANK